jgi:intron-binding protein aquarius
MPLAQFLLLKVTHWILKLTIILLLYFQALNQLFEKIMALDIDERHLLRLGHGEEELETEKDFSR